MKIHFLRNIFTPVWMMTIHTLAMSQHVEPRYALLPVRQEAEKKVFHLTGKDGEVLRFGSIHWDAENPEFTVGVDLQDWPEESLQLRVDGEPVDLVISDTIPGEEQIYQEPDRPRVHFSAKRGWLNDANGLVFHEGVWHLFFQHNPYGSRWGNMHWGHAISTDLAHWEEQPIAIRPVYKKSLKDFAFSGSAVFDAHNTLGLTNGPALIAVYTSTGRGESLATSYDNGQTWKDYPGNPVLIHGKSNSGTPGEDDFWHDSRDPKVFWFGDEEDGHWVMVVYEQYAERKGKSEDSAFAIYVSENLRDWERTQVLTSWYECPEFFEIEVEGRPGVKKWVLLGAYGFYQMGEFDGRVFRADPREGESDPVAHLGRPYAVLPGMYHGPYWNSFAGQGWNGVPKQDGRTLFISWLRGEGKAESSKHFSQKMSVPIELSLRETPDGLRLHFNPAEELQRLQQAPVVQDFSGSGEALDAALAKIDAVAFRMSGQWVVDMENPSSLRIHGMELIYHPDRGTIEDPSIHKDERNPLMAINARYRELPVGQPKDGRLEFEVIGDQGAIEVFFKSGRYYGARTHTHSVEQRGVTQTNLKVENLTVYPLKSIYQTGEEGIYPPR